MKKNHYKKGEKVRVKDGDQIYTGEVKWFDRELNQVSVLWYDKDRVDIRCLFNATTKSRLPFEYEDPDLQDPHTYLLD